MVFLMSNQLIASRVAVSSFHRKVKRKAVLISDAARKIFISGSSGSGKTLLMARQIAWQDFIHGIPVVLMDPHGPMIDNFLDKFIRQPVAFQKKNGYRIRYVDMSGRWGYVTPIPLYYRMGNESLAEIAGRPLEVFLKLDPNLQSASIQGWNALKTTGTFFGMLATALNLQVTEAASMLGNPSAWNGRIREALAINNELEPAVMFLKELAEAKPRERRNQTASFFTKIEQFTLDPYMRAQWAASEPAIDWVQVEEQGLAVLLDFRYVQQTEQRMFSMMFALNFLLDYIKQRGAGRHQPISLFIDELTALFPVIGKAAEQLALDIDGLINQYCRNYALWLCVSTQELYQFGERLAKTLLSMPTQIHGVTSDPGAAEILAQRFFRFDPYWVKKYERVWMSDDFGPFVVDHTSDEFSTDEQIKIHAQKFLNLRPFQFLVCLPNQEGSLIGPLRKMSISKLDPGLFPNAELVAYARDMLMQRDGQPIDNVLSEIQARTESAKGLTHMSTLGLEADLKEQDEIPFYGE